MSKSIEWIGFASTTRRRAVFFADRHLRVEAAVVYDASEAVWEITVQDENRSSVIVAAGEARTYADAERAAFEGWQAWALRMAEAAGLIYATVEART